MSPLFCFSLVSIYDNRGSAWMLELHLFASCHSKLVTEEFGKNKQKYSVRINWLLAGHLQDYCVFCYSCVCCTSFTSVRFTAGVCTRKCAHEPSPLVEGWVSSSHRPIATSPVTVQPQLDINSQAMVLMWLRVQDNLVFIKRNDKYFYLLGIREESG